MISINFTLVVQVINFLVLMWLLNRILFRPIFKVIEEREGFILTARRDVARLEKKAGARHQEVEAQLARAKKAANAARDEQVSRAREKAKGIMDQATEKGQAHVQEIMAESARQAKQVSQDLLSHSEPLVEAVCAKFLGRKQQCDK